MTAETIVLRNLHGVAELESRLKRIDAHPNPEWAPETEGLDQEVDELSLRLFGLTSQDTWWPPGDGSPSEEDDARWGQHFEVLYTDDLDGAAKVYEALGLDVLDQGGEEMRALAYLGRQLICVAKGLAGRRPGGAKTDAELEDEAQRWATDLLRKK